MKTMKKCAAIVLALLIGVVALAGCGTQEKPPAETPSGGKISVVATIFPPYDFARAIAGDLVAQGKVELVMLLPPGSESHSFEPTPQDIIAIQNCDVFLYVGGESDEWVNDILASMDTSRMRIVPLVDCVELVEEEIKGSMQDEEEAEEEGEEPEYDEHVWTSPRNAKLIVQKISSALCEADPGDADIYKANTAAYLAKLDELDAQFRAVVDGAARKTIVFGDRFPFRYFVDAYGLKYDAAFPGCATETEASAKTVKGLIDRVKAEGIPVVFHIELSNEKIADAISEATGAKVLLLNACHNLTKADFDAGKTYLDFMAANVEALKEALG